MCCGAEATPVDDNGQRVQLARGRQLFGQLHPLLVLQFQIPRHFSTPRRPRREFRRGGGSDVYGGGAATDTGCHDYRTRRCPQRGTGVVAVDTVRATGTPEPAAAETHDLSDRIQRDLTRYTQGGSDVILFHIYAC